jgi:hypothetical protein
MPIPPDRRKYWTVKTCKDACAQELKRATIRRWKRDKRKLERERRERKENKS